jgi:hypothetical protein
MELKQAYKKIKAAERLNDIKYQSFGQVKFIHVWINYKTWNGIHGYKNLSYAQFKKYLLLGKNGNLDLDYGVLEALKRLCSNRKCLYSYFRYAPEFGISKSQPIIVSEHDCENSIPF